jgi:mRNA interferase RelE/StbE
MFKVDLSRKAQEFYKKADRPLARKLARCFEQLEPDPRHHGNIKPLAGNLAGHYRYRVGDYRVI